MKNNKAKTNKQTNKQRKANMKQATKNIKIKYSNE